VLACHDGGESDLRSPARRLAFAVASTLDWKRRTPHSGRIRLGCRSAEDRRPDRRPARRPAELTPVGREAAARM